jgi:hypothetical protein
MPIMSKQYIKSAKDRLNRDETIIKSIAHAVHLLQYIAS